ncbi:MAG: hypothetical protein K6E34_11825 [Lachnospiraceae bacterium]|nr:hypothetical protein [Lachnospiraceae bacterium]
MSDNGKIRTESLDLEDGSSRKTDMSMETAAPGGVRNYQFLFSVCTVSILLIIDLILFTPFFENRADIIMNDLIRGAYEAGTPTSAVLFSNYILAKLLIAISGISGTAPVYLIFHDVCTFAAMVTVSYLTLKRKDSITVRILTAGVMIFMSYEAFALPGYMKTTVYLALAAVYLLEYQTEHGFTILFTALALAYGIIAGLTSFFLFFAAYATGCIYVIIYFAISGRFTTKTEKGKNAGAVRGLIIAVIISGILVIVGAGLYYADRLYYFSHPELSSSIAYRTGYEKALSYGVPHTRYRDEEIQNVTDAIYRLGALDIDQVDTNERMLVLGEMRLFLSPHEIHNFFRFEPYLCLKVPMMYLLGFLLYMVWRYRKKRGGAMALGVFIVSVLTLYAARTYLCLGYDWMYTLQMLPAIMMLMLSFDEIEYEAAGYMTQKSSARSESRKSSIMMCVHFAVLVYLAVFLFESMAPVRGREMTQKETLYEENETEEGEDTADMEGADSNAG